LLVFDETLDVNIFYLSIGLSALFNVRCMIHAYIFYLFISHYKVIQEWSTQTANQ